MNNNTNNKNNNKEKLIKRKQNIWLLWVTLATGVVVFALSFSGMLCGLSIMSKQLIHGWEYYWEIAFIAIIIGSCFLTYVFLKYMYKIFLSLNNKPNNAYEDAIKSVIECNKASFEKTNNK